MNYGIESQSQLEAIDKLLQADLIHSGIKCAILIDTAGNTISSCNDGKGKYDTYAFAALAAGNFATVESMAQLAGETEFSQLYHKGENVSLHFCKINEDLLLINIFDNSMSLGLLRLKATEINKIAEDWMKSTMAEISTYEPSSSE